MNARFAPIPVGKVLPAPTHFCPAVLEPPRSIGSYDGMDDTGDYAEAMGREALEGMLVVDCPEAA